MPCRAKKAKCSGDKPACTNCERGRLACTWPDGRKRKRTRKEMEADFGKRPALATAEEEQTMAGLAYQSNVPYGFQRSESMSTSAHIVPEGSASAAGRFAFPAEIGSARGIDPGIRPNPGPLLSQTINTFRSGPTFSPQPPTTMFFGANTGFPLHQPSVATGVDPVPSGPAVLDAGSAATGMPTPHTIWQLLANLSPQGSVLPTYGNQEDDALQMLSGMNEQSAGSTSTYSQIPVPPESLFQIPASHDPSPQLPQPGTASTGFSPFNPPAANTASRDGKTTEACDRHAEARVAPTENAAAETGTPSITGLVKAITNQIGYLEGDESKPYLRLHYFRVVSRLPWIFFDSLIVEEYSLGRKHM